MERPTPLGSVEAYLNILPYVDLRELFRVFAESAVHCDDDEFNLSGSTLTMKLTFKGRPETGLMWGMQCADPDNSAYAIEWKEPSNPQKKTPLFFGILCRTENPELGASLCKAPLAGTLCTYNNGTLYVSGVEWTEEVRDQLMKALGYKEDGTFDAKQALIGQISCLYLGPKNIQINPIQVKQPGDEAERTEVQAKEQKPNPEENSGRPDPTPEPKPTSEVEAKPETRISTAKSKGRILKYKIPERFDVAVRDIATTATSQQDFIDKVAAIIRLSPDANKVFGETVRIAKSCNYNSTMIRSCLSNFFMLENIKMFLSEANDGLMSFYPEGTSPKAIKALGVIVAAIEKYENHVGEPIESSVPEQATEGEKLPDSTLMFKVTIPLLGTEIEVEEDWDKARIQRAILEEIGCKPDLIETVMAALENPEDLSPAHRMKLGVEILGPYCKENGCKKPTAVDFLKALKNL